ncbi:MAG: hypothetical protein HY951_05255 [Bacteroidia bacterium]|nr:hypothetical protein [Bacteroidia bacterium]
MNKYIFPKVVLVSCFLITLLSCESREQNKDDAFDMVKEEKMLSNDNYIFSKEKIKVPIKIEQNANNDEWIKFKNEIEKRIMINVKLIKDIKSLTGTSKYLFKKIISLEKDNYDLRNQMEIYNEEVNANLKRFKLLINSDVDNIRLELSNLSEGIEK